VQTSPEPTVSQGGALSEHVYNELIHALKVGDYAGRSRLPSETEMAARFEVSRPVLRQALTRLKSEGIIHSTRGSGNFVSRGQEATLGLAPLQTIPDVKRCLEFRRVLESEAAATAAGNRSPEKLANIEAAFERLKSGGHEGDEAVDADFNFHMAIAEATNSQYYVQCLKALRPHILFGINLIRSLALGNPATRLQRVALEHQLIVAAIAQGDAAAARKAMADHLQAGIDRFFN
jgi:GntR family transcriptional repressor for pyruvate dehydrogenase complex